MCQNGEILLERPGWLGIFPVDKTKPIQVDFKFSMPPSKYLAWCYVYAIIKETKWESQKGYATIEFSEDGLHWKVLNRREISQTKLYWDCSLECQIQFDHPLSEFYFRITSTTNISGIHCYGHLLEKNHNGILKIKHHWEENNIMHTFEAPDNENKYEFSCPTVPINHVIEMWVPSLENSY